MYNLHSRRKEQQSQIPIYHLVLSFTSETENLPAERGWLIDPPRSAGRFLLLATLKLQEHEQEIDSLDTRLEL